MRWLFYVYHSLLPHATGFACLLGGVSVHTFWAALIKATRQWGSSSSQGISFGLLDGGRGAVAAILATAAAAAFASSTDVATSLKKVLLIYSVAPLLTGVLICGYSGGAIRLQKSGPVSI
ncbi:MAG: hypothetical protein U5L96_17265 [Owenweeksia sp.]|nr:hypothetical protein [Owenweeksia sp.]